MSLSHKIRVGVLRGGPSPEYDVSLKTGASMLSNLPNEYEGVDILISKEGVWHEKGLEKSPGSVLGRVDVVLNGLHGKYGEDGEVQRILEQFQIPFTGPSSLGAALSMNKAMSKKIYSSHGIKTPVSITINTEELSRQKIKEVYENLVGPFIVKPASAGSSIGVYLAHSLPELEEAIVAAGRYSPQIIVEEFIKGKEATCGVVEGFRNEEHYALLPIEIRHGKEFFDYKAKYGDKGTEEICPGNFSQEEMDQIRELSKQAHKALGLRHYSRSDFIVHPKRGIYILETNSLPGLTEHSLIPKSLAAIGSNIKDFLGHILKKTLGKK